MSDAPNRIWAFDQLLTGAIVHGEWADCIRYGGGTEYLRADLVANLIAASTAMRDQIEQWHNGGPAAGPEESRALFKALDVALRAMECRPWRPSPPRSSPEPSRRK